jgi:hypothetical protein
MGVRCEKCGHENDQQFLFCGMCGQRLPSVEWQETNADPASPPKPSSESLFPSDYQGKTDSVSYLLTDDEEEVHPRHTGRLYLALLLLVVSLVLLAAHWRQYAHSWISEYVARSAASNPGEASETSDNPASPVETKPPETQPASSASNSPTHSSPAKPPSKEETSASAAPDETPTNSPPEKSQPAVNTPPAQPITKKTEPAKPAPPGQDLVTQGEKYLYGNGVPEDCALARKKLATAADRQNARALTLMGTMYATGHCAPRDLPTAYGWFAKALRIDPANHRIEDDLSTIWKQMTPGEKQVALKK